MARKSAGLETGLRDLVAEHVDELVNLITDVVRKNVSDQVQALLDRSDSYTASAKKTVTRRSRRGRDMACLAPGCPSTSKGPRFRYLCEAHVGASAKDVETWRKTKRETSAVAAKGGKANGQKNQTNGAKARRAGRRSGIRPCIAVDCKNPSKGPRFRFLCATHRGASSREIQAWRRARQVQAAA